MSQLTQGGITFSNGEKLTRDPIRLMTALLGLSNGSLPNNSDYATWYVNIPGRNARGTLYNDYHTIQRDSYGGEQAYVYGGQNKVVINNHADATLRVNVVGGVFDNTDDTWQYLVYRDGAAVSPSAHSGGSVIINSGNQAPSGVGPYTTTVTQDIAAYGSATFWLYCGVLNGSNWDKLGPYMAVTFNSWV